MAGKLRLRPSVCFEIEKVIGVSIGTGNTCTYQVQWAPAWVSGYHMIGCEHLIQEFFQKQSEFNVNTNDQTIVEGVMLDEDRVDKPISQPCKISCDSSRIIEEAAPSPGEEVTESHFQDLLDPTMNTSLNADDVDETCSVFPTIVKEEEELEGDDYNVETVLDGSGCGRPEGYKDSGVSLSRDMHHTDLFQSSDEQTVIPSEFSGVTMCTNSELNSYNSYSYSNYNTKEKKKKCSETGNDRYKCEDCGKTFKFRYLLRRHMPVHIDGLRYRCKYCEKSYARKDSLMEHLITHSVGVHQSGDRTYSFLGGQDSPPLQTPDQM